MTNFIKFPFYEVTNVLINNVAVPPQVQGAVTGAVFCTLCLPITNYRFYKSVGLPVDVANLYKAYIPTVLRDMAYGVARNWITRWLSARYPTIGVFARSFLATLFACLASAPFNEIRGYYLQPVTARKPPSVFFQPPKFFRSTCVGALIMATALGVGNTSAPVLSQLLSNLRAWGKQNPTDTIVILFVLNQYSSFLRNKSNKKD